MIDDVRQRMTEGLTRARVELELRRAVRPAIVVLAAMGLLAGMAAFVVSRVAPGMFESSYRVAFAVDDATAVQPGLAEVRFKGLPVGRVEEVEVRGDEAIVTAEMTGTYGRVYRDARVALRPITALKDMYLDVVDRGTPSAGLLEEDEPLPSSRTSMPVDVGEVLNLFEPTVRTRLRTLLDDLGNGLHDRGEALRSIFVEAAPFVDLAGQVSDQLAARQGRVRRLVRNTGLLSEELARRDGQLRTLVREGSSALTTLQAGRGDLDATLRELAPTVSAVRPSFAALRGVLDDVDGAVRALRPVADALPDSLEGLVRLSDDARPALRQLRPPVRDLVPLARVLQPLSRELDVAVTTLRPQVDTLNKVTRGLDACTKGIQNFFQWNTSISKFGDARGPIPRGNVVAGAQSSALLNDPQEFAPQGCGGGRIIGGRLPEPGDFR